MHIGIDFDNTIVSYDSLFHRVAREQGLIPADLAPNKVAVRDHLRQTGREETWIAMQGEVYGSRMDEAEIYSGFLEFLDWARRAGHGVSIVSHKTRYPFAGPRYDLHQAARHWVGKNLLGGDEPRIAESAIYFELTKQEKLQRIGAIGCEVFIDDLPEILLADALPADLRRVLFDPDGNHSPLQDGQLAAVSSWFAAKVLLDV
jgi:hypothetical protein